MIPHRNKSSYGWWIATYIIRAGWADEPKPSTKSRCLAWENTIILQAPDRDAAYEKAVSLAAKDEGEYEDDAYPGRRGQWILEGLTSLLPIYEELQDGAEIMWEEHSGRTVGKIRSWVKKKKQLEVFNDSAQSRGN